MEQNDTSRRTARRRKSDESPGGPLPSKGKVGHAAPLTSVEDPGVYYHNILILEESLREAYNKNIRTKRTYQTFFIAITIWNVYFFYGVWIHPSHYYYISLLFRFCFYSGVVTYILFFATGMYHRNIHQTRRFLPYTNRCLRVYNLKLVPNPAQKWWLPFWWRKRGLGQGGVKLVLSGKGLDDDFREGWEIFRAEYWESEELRLARKADRDRARKKSGGTPKGRLSGPTNNSIRATRVKKTVN